MLRPKRAGTVTVLLCALAIVAGTTASHAATPAPTTAPRASAVAHATTCRRPHKAGQFSQSFKFKGKTRTYQLYVPKAYKGTTRVPLVFNFHGFGSNAVQQMFYGDFKPQSEKNDFLIVAPDGQDNGSGRHFSFGNEPGLQNDLNMVQSLLAHLGNTLCVDGARVYSTGMSDGGAITSLLACTAPNRFAAFAPVAVVLYCGQSGKRPIAMASFQGTADPIVPFKGGAVQCCGGAVLPSKPVTMAKWAAYDKCAKQYTDTRLGSEVVRRRWKSCAKGGAIDFYIIQGGGHTWPGAIPIPRFGLTTQQIRASDVIWKFFAAHKLAS